MTTSSEDLSSQGPARMVPEQSTTALVARALRRPKVVGVVLLAAEVVLRLASLLGGRGGNADYHDVDFFGAAALAVIVMAMARRRPTAQNQYACGALLIIVMMIGSTHYLRFTGRKMWDDTFNVLDFTGSIALLVVGVIIMGRTRRIRKAAHSAPNGGGAARLPQ
ncbi:MAG: hypothetical protein L0L50_08525 [Propionibacterium sp.]|nr:hypothetical protein [Propionibacterium sp.]